MYPASAIRQRPRRFERSTVTSSEDKDMTSVARTSAHDERLGPVRADWGQVQQPPDIEMGGIRRIRITWWLLFFNVLGSGTSPVLHIPHRIAQLMTQGALGVALLLALSANPRLRLRTNVYLGVFMLLAITSLMASVRFVSIGTDYRALRLLMFVVVLWLSTPWWGRRDLLLLRAQVGFVAAIIISVLLGLVLAPSSAIGGGRLSGVLWPIPATQVAHYAAELSGLGIVLWACRLLRRSVALLMGLGGFVILILAHTRTALLAEAVGLVFALVSLLARSRRVRRGVAGVTIAVAVAGVPLAPLAVNWLARGQNVNQLASLTGRTQFWADVFSEQRNLTQRILGDGISNGSINPPPSANVPTVQGGRPIDDSWVLDYQDQGIIGDVLTGLMFVLLLSRAAFTRSGPRRALALFLVMYCLIASFTEDGAGIASQYAMDLSIAASLLVPEVASMPGPLAVKTSLWGARYYRVHSPGG